MRGIILLMGLTIVLLSFPTAIIAQESDTLDLAQNTEKSVIQSLPMDLYNTPKFWSKPFMVDCKSPKQCNRIAVRLRKKNRPMEAVSTASVGLVRDKLKKRTQKKLLSVLEGGLANAKQEYDRERAVLLAKTTSFVGVESAFHAYQLFVLEQKYHSMTEHLIRAKDARTWNGKLPYDNSKELQDSETRSNGYIEQAAEVYKKNGFMLLKDAKETGKRYEYKKAWTNLFIGNDYRWSKDVEEAALEAKKHATSTFYFARPNLWNRYAKVGFNYDAELRKELLQRSDFKKLPFAEVTVDRSKADYEVRTSIKKPVIEDFPQQIEKKKITIKVKTEQKDADGKPVFVEKEIAITQYFRRSKAYVDVTYEVIDRKTKQVVFASENRAKYLWEHVFARTNADKGILGRKWRKLVEAPSLKRPPNQDFYDLVMRKSPYLVTNVLFNKLIEKKGAAIKS